MEAGPGRDQQFAETEMIATVGFDRPAVDIDPTHARSQMGLNIAIPIKRGIMDQNFRPIRTLEKNSFDNGGR